MASLAGCGTHEPQPVSYLPAISAVAGAIVTTQPAPAPDAETCKGCNGKGYLGDGREKFDCPECEEDWQKQEPAAAVRYPLYLYTAKTGCAACEQLSRSLADPEVKQIIDAHFNLIVIEDPAKVAAVTPRVPLLVTGDSRLLGYYRPDTLAEWLQEQLAKLQETVAATKPQDHHHVRSI